MGYLPKKYEEEYILYNETVTKCLEKYNTVWYDLFGNHDADAIYGRNDPRNYANKIMLPCKHSACSNCIRKHMEKHNECFFCKLKIEELKHRSELGMDDESATTN